MAIAFVQVANKTVGVASTTLAYGSNNTAGNLLLLTARVTTAATVVTVTDSNHNDWQKISTTTNGTSTTSLFYAPNCKVGANTVSIFGGATTNSIQMVIAEYSGVNTLDQLATAGPTTSVSFSSGNITTTQANELLIGFGENETANSLTISPTNSFTLETNGSASGNAFMIDRIVSSTGTFAATAGFSASVAWAGGVASFYNDPAFPHANPYFIQSANGASSAGAALALPYSSNNTAGSLLVAVCRYAGATSPTIADSQVNSWQTAVSFTSTTSLIRVFYVLSAKVGANTVTFDATGGSRVEQAVILEYSATTTFDQEVHATGSGLFPTSPAITTAASLELLVNYIENETIGSLSDAPYLGFVNRNSSAGNVFSADRVVSASTLTAIYGYGNTAAVAWGTGVVAFNIQTSNPSATSWVNRHRKFINKR